MQEVWWVWGAITLWVGLSGTAYFFLNKRLNDLSDKIIISADFSKQIVQLVSDVHEIKTALLGSYEKKGLIGKVSELERELAEFVKR